MTVELRDKLTHKAKAKALFKTFEINELELIIESASTIINDKRQQHIDDLKQYEKQQETIEKARDMLAKAGITLDSKGLKASTNIPKKAFPDKYKVTDSDGNVRLWTGMGYSPKQFKQAYDFGYKKDELLIAANVVLTVPFDKLVGCELI